VNCQEAGSILNGSDLERKIQSPGSAAALVLRLPTSSNVDKESAAAAAHLSGTVGVDNFFL
jgi:hypothetical protein